MTNRATTSQSYLPILLACGLAAPLFASGDPGAEVSRADEAMSAACEKRNVADFAGFLGSDTVFLNQGKPAEGPEAVKVLWAEMFVPDGPKLTWKPSRAVVAHSGDLAYTVGDFVLEQGGENGNTQLTGQYVTVWKRAGNGGWRVLFDASLKKPLTPEPKLHPTRDAASKDGDITATIGTFELSEGRKKPIVGTYLRISAKASDPATILTCVPAVQTP